MAGEQLIIESLGGRRDRREERRRRRVMRSETLLRGLDSLSTMRLLLRKVGDGSLTVTQASPKLAELADTIEVDAGRLAISFAANEENPFPGQLRRAEAIILEFLAAEAGPSAREQGELDGIIKEYGEAAHLHIAPIPERSRIRNAWARLKRP